MASIELDITFFIQAGLFLSLVYILNTLVFRPIKKVMEERDEKIGNDLGEARSMEDQIEEKLADYRARLEEAKQAGNLERARLKKEGLSKETEIVSAALEDAKKAIGDAKAKIRMEKESASKALKDMTEEMGRSIAEKALGRSL